MAWIRTVPPGEAQGLLARIYADGIQRAGRVWQILRVMSLNPRQLRASMAIYQSVMLADSSISRREREMLAVVVSRANDCHYWLHAHAHDLRAEAGSPELADHLLRDDWRSAPLSPAERALCAYAEKLTLEPGAAVKPDLEPLRDAGYSDEQIHDAVQAIAYFNYINRVADGLGVDLETEMPPDPRG